MSEILKKNFRSTKEIVNFNNDFFDTVAKKINDKEYQALYSEKSNNLNNLFTKMDIQIYCIH